MDIEELKSKYYIHNGYLVFDSDTAYRVDTIREVYLKGSFLFVTFKDCSFINCRFEALDVDTIDFIQELNKEIQHNHTINKLISVDFVVFSLLVIITVVLGIWWLLQ